MTRIKHDFFTNFYASSQAPTNHFSLKIIHNVKKIYTFIDDLKTHKLVVLHFSKDFWIYCKHLQMIYFILYLNKFSLLHGS